jgi:hypothetical protein
MPYNIDVGQKILFPDIYVYTANITSYDGTTKIATLDAPVDVSLGYNRAGGSDLGHPINSSYSIKGNLTNVAQAVQQGGIPKLSTDEAGNFVGIFNVPPDRFQTGQRVFRIDNRTTLTDVTSATTWAEATFTASGLSQKTGQTNFSPAIDSSASSFIQDNQQYSQLISNIAVTNYGDPIAQTFIVNKDNYPNGIFIKSVKIFFFSKPSQNIPVKLSIVGTLNGYPNGKKLDYSTVILNGDQVVVSKRPHYLDTTTYTEFVFDAPVYIQPGIAHAFMLETNSSDYRIYYAQQNQITIPSTARANPADSDPTNPTKIGSIPYIGSLFESQNGQTWTADQTKSLMFVIDRCVFDNTQTPQIDFVIPKGLPNRKLGHQDIQHLLDPYVVPNTYANFYTDLPSDAINLTTTDFTPTGTGISYEYTSTLGNGNVLNGPFPVNPGKYGVPTPDNIYYNDGQGERILLSTSNSSFKMTAQLSSSDPNLSPVISDDGVTVFNLRYIINNMGIQNNVISLVNGGDGYSNTANITVNISDPDVGSDPAILGVTSNNTSGQIESVYTIYPGSGYITTPTITISDTGTGANAVVVVAGETSPNGGNSYAKYFTKKVVLTPENDSGDLRVYLTAWRPLGTNIYVYYKVMNREDSSTFEDSNWNLMTMVGNTNTYSTKVRENYIEYEYAPGTLNKPDNYISYTKDGKTYTSFSQFAIKVVMASDDNTQVPVLTDIRALALPTGTGL